MEVRFLATFLPTLFHPIMPDPKYPHPKYPQARLRRLRRHDWSRQLVCENRLSPSDLIWPLFICEGKNQREPIASMPGVERLSIDLAVKAIGEAASLGIPAVALFPATADDKKNARVRGSCQFRQLGLPSGSRRESSPR